VRFANDKAPFRAIYYAIKESLESETAETLRLGAWESVLEGTTPEPVVVPFSPPAPLVTGRSPRATGPSLTPPASRTSDTEAVMELYRPPEPREWPPPPLPKLATPTPLAVPAVASSEPATSSSGDLKAPQQLCFERPSGPSRPRLRYLSTLYRSYLVMEVDGELWVVDQHAAHERIQYERLHRFQIVGPQSQGLVIPLEIELTAVQSEALEAHSERFAEVGFELELNGQQALLKAVPPGLPGGKVAAFFSELLSELVDEGLTTETPVAQYREKLRAMMACKASVRARESVSETEALRLVSDLMEAERSPYCPHGRPTRIRLDLTALERLFQR
jgi:DNA mismatch repair ATPase MutL